MSVSWLRRVWENKLMPRVNGRVGRLGYKVVCLDLDALVHARISKTDSSDFFFIQVGAFDGVSNDPLTKYIKNYRLRGVLIEPQSDVFARLKANYRDHGQLLLLNVAISNTNEFRNIYKVQSGIETLPAWSHQLASFDRENILKHKEAGQAFGPSCIPDIEKYIVTEQVECITFDRVLDAANANKVDLLQIDAEGYDFELIKSFPFDRLKPAIVRYEHMHLSKKQQNQCISFLKERGYRLIFEPADTVAYLPRQCGF